MLTALWYGRHGREILDQFAPPDRTMMSGKAMSHLPHTTIACAPRRAVASAALGMILLFIPAPLPGSMTTALARAADDRPACNASEVVCWFMHARPMRLSQPLDLP